MVHGSREHGAHGRRTGDTLVIAHRLGIDLDRVGVVDDPVTDGAGQGGVVQVLVSLAGVVIVRVFAMRRAVNWRWSGLATTRWNASRWHTFTNLREKSSAS